MARTRSARPRGKTKSTVRVDLSNVSKAFEPNQEYAVRIVECTLEEGQKAPYFNIKLQGIEGGEYENSTMYHRASTGETSLWRLRPFLEAFQFDIPDGPLDLDASDFIGREAMCSTYLDRYEGGSSVKPDEFWELEDGASDGGKDDKATDFDLDELDDDQIEALAEAVGVKGRNTAAKKKALAKMDEDELAEAFAELGDGDKDKDEDGAPEFDLDDLGDDDIMKLAEELEVTAKTAKRARTALGKLDPDDVAEAWASISDGGKDDKGDAGDISEDDIQEMNEDELEKVVEQYELDLDLSDYKTLRKMKNAVIDAMEEGGHFE